MNDSQKIMQGYQDVAPDKAEVLAASAIAQGEMLAWVFAKFIKNGWAKEEEIEAFLKELRGRAGRGMQANIYDFVMNRVFMIEKEDN